MEDEGLEWWERALEGAMQRLADNLRVVVLLDHEGTFRHALALFKDFKNAVEALVLIRSGMVVPLTAAVCGLDWREYSE